MRRRTPGCRANGGLFFMSLIFLCTLLDDKQLGLASKMIAREMAVPTRVFDGIIETYARHIARFSQGTLHSLGQADGGVSA